MVMKTNVVIRKISWFLCLALIGMSGAMQAQNKIGVSALVGSSNIEVNGLGVLDLLDPYIKSIPQYNMGLVYERQFNRQWSVVTGAQYSSRGFGVREDANVKLFGIE